jgi:hypothetical protein
MSFKQNLVLLWVALVQVGISQTLAAAGQNSALIAQGNIEAVPRQVPCSKSEFKYFFRVFVRGLDEVFPRSAVRNTYVWPQIEVRSYRYPSRLLATAPKQDYLGDGFRIGLQDNLWVYLDPATRDYNYPRIAIKFKNLTSQKIAVEYIQAEYVSANNGNAQQERLVKTFGKSGAYIFEHRSGCWRLTQELRSDQSVVNP